MNQEEANEKILKLMNKSGLLSKKEIKLFKELIFQCDLKQKNYRSYTPLMYAFKYNKEQNLNLNEEQIDYLIKNSDLTQQNKDGKTPLLYALTNNKEQNLNLREEKIDYLIKNSDLKQKNKNGWTPLMYAFKYNKEQNLNLNEEQWGYFIKNSDLTQKNDNGLIPIMHAFMCNKKQDLNINKEQWDYLIKNSELTQQKKYNWSIFVYGLIFNKTQNLNLSSKQFKTMYAVLNEKQKQTTFENWIKTNVKNYNNYVDEMNILLYDCEFQPNQETINWLKENNYQDIIQIIEKRDVFFQLNQESQSIKNNKKITTIKL